MFLAILHASPHLMPVLMILQQALTRQLIIGPLFRARPRRAPCRDSFAISLVSTAGRSSSAVPTAAGHRDNLENSIGRSTVPLLARQPKSLLWMRNVPGDPPLQLST